MRVTVRGLGRDHGEKEIVNIGLMDPEESSDGSYYPLLECYVRVENAYLPKMAKAKLSVGTQPLRLGGQYLLGVELSREEIAKLFFATHKGDLVVMFKSLLEDEARQAEEEERRREAEQRAAMLERHRQRMARNERRELLEQFGEKFASLNKRDKTAPAESEAEPKPE